MLPCWGMPRDDDLFQSAMEGVEPLADEDRPQKVLKRRVSKKPQRIDLGPPVSFRIDKLGERIEALGPNVGRESLRRLLRGVHEIDHVVDLHGQTEDAAHDMVAYALERAWSEGWRCLQIIHGRGLHSEEGWSVLKERLPGWLAEVPHGRRILAFATATPDRGGTGATLVLLRKRRREKT